MHYFRPTLASLFRLFLAHFRVPLVDYVELYRNGLLKGCIAYDCMS